MTTLTRYVPLRRTGFKRKKKSSLQKRIEDPNSKYWRARADLAWGRYIHMIFNDRCAVNDGTCKGNGEAHHLCGRTPVVRHNVDLGILLCTLHHKYSRTCSPHGGPAGFFVWLSEAYPHKMKLCGDYYRGELKRSLPTFKDAAEYLETFRVKKEVMPGL